MKRQNVKNLSATIVLLVSFIAWTLLVSFVDVKAVGPIGSCVGFAKINTAFHSLTGVHFTLYNITDWLGLVPIAFALGFAVLGLCEWIKRRGLQKVDYSLFVLGGFYIVTIAVYILFENVVVNYRPTLIDGYLEVSYPSSTTLLVLTVMPTALLELKERIKHTTLRKCVVGVIVLFIIFMVGGRLISGVHWLTDIIGGVLLSSALVMGYYSVVSLKK